MFERLKVALAFLGICAVAGGFVGGVVTFVPDLVTGLPGGTTSLSGLVRVCDEAGSCPTGSVSTGDGDLIVEDAVEVDGALNVAGATTLAAVTLTTITGANGGTIDNATNNAWDFNENSEDLVCTFSSNLATWASTTGATVAFTPAVALADSLTFSDGAIIDQSANNVIGITENGEDITFTFASNSVTIASTTGSLFTITPATTFSGVATFSDAVTLSDGATLDQSANNVVGITENGEDWNATFASNSITFASTTGALPTWTPAATFSTSVATPIVATGTKTIRFCGNLPGSGTAVTSYISPVPEAPILGGTANYEFGGTGCDGEDNATVGTADEVVTAVTMTPVAIKCAGICTGGSAANDLHTFAVMDDGAAVTGGPTCTFTFAGDATLAQCALTLAPGATAIAGNSAIAVRMVNTDDDCDDAGDDVECFVTFAVN